MVKLLFTHVYTVGIGNFNNREGQREILSTSEIICFWIKKK